MKKFVKTILFSLLIPLVLIIVLELFMSPTFFTFRVYEAIIFKSKVPHIGYFYPNMKIHMENSVGDLCHHTKYAVLKNEYWITDEIGFRNDLFIKSPDIIIIGSSYIYGSGLSQKEIISNQLNEQLKNKYSVYNMANCTMGEFDYYLRNGIIDKPKVIIYSNVEVSLPTPYKSFELKENSFFKNVLKDISYSGVNVIADRLTRLYSITWMRARINSYIGFGIQSPIDSKMFFSQGKDVSIYSKDDINKSVEAIKSIKKYCDSLQIKLIYLPIPNKETVYYDLVPLKTQPKYLMQLDSILHTHNIQTINILGIFNDYRKHNSNLLYHYDDTHWNANGVKLVANEITTKILNLYSF